MIRRSAHGLLLAVLVGCVTLPALAVAAEPIAVITSASDPKRTVSIEDLALIYRRKRLYWPDGSKVVPINLPASSQERRDFSTALFAEPVEASESYWNDMYFHGITPPFVASSVEAVMRFVAQSSTSIGYVPLCSVDHRVSVILVLDANGVVSNPQAAMAACPH